MHTYTKLHSGVWGVRCTERVEPGQYVEITKRNGTTSFACVDKIVWQGPDHGSNQTVWVCSILEGTQKRGTLPKALPKALPTEVVPHASTLPQKRPAPGRRAWPKAKAPRPNLNDPRVDIRDEVGILDTTGETVAETQAFVF